MCDTRTSCIAVDANSNNHDGYNLSERVVSALWAPHTHTHPFVIRIVTMLYIIDENLVERIYTLHAILLLYYMVYQIEHNIVSNLPIADAWHFLVRWRLKPNSATTGASVRTFAALPWVCCVCLCRSVWQSTSSLIVCRNVEVHGGMLLLFVCTLCTLYYNIFCISSVRAKARSLTQIETKELYITCTLRTVAQNNCVWSGGGWVGAVLGFSSTPTLCAWMCVCSPSTERVSVDVCI